MPIPAALGASSPDQLSGELLRGLSTGYMVADAVLFLLVPLLLQQLLAFLQGSEDPMFSRLYDWLFVPAEPKGVTRVIGITQRYTRDGYKVWDYEQKNHLLQKAITIYLADVLDLTNKDAKYNLLKKPKKSVKHISSDDECDGDTTASSCDTAEDSDDEDVYYGVVDKLNWEALPNENEWIEVEHGVKFKHETIKPEEDSGDKKKTTTETNVNFKFFSTLPDGSERIDALVKQAFTNYQNIERKRYVQDKKRYFYIQSGTRYASENEAAAVLYKRYALGEEKTFDNLFFKEKDQVVQLLDNFTNKAGKFAIKGFPYKLGLLLHGPPGTGKTSLIKAVAQHTRRHIVTISLGKIQTNQQLLDAIFDMKFAVQGLDSPIEMSFEDVVFVMEDIDCASAIVNARDDDSKGPPTKTVVSGIEDSETSEKPSEEASVDSVEDKLVSTMIKVCLDDEKKYDQRNDKLNLSGLLNVLDGVIDCPGRMVIMTTNHPEKLDPALVRPGRVNKKLLLGYMGCTHIQQMIEYYCVAKFDRAQEERLRIAFKASSQTLTPAVVEEICAEFDDIDAVLSGFERLVATQSA